jgi:tetratricopeptide (TPR) repeat protein
VNAASKGRAVCILSGVVLLAALGCGSRDATPAPGASDLAEARRSSEAGEAERAAASFERALAVLPEGPDAAHARWEHAVVLDELQRFDEALLELDRALAFREQETPKPWEELVRVRNSRANLLLRLGRFDAAEREASEAVTIVRGHGMGDTTTEAVVRYTLGSILTEQRSLDRAIDELGRARALNARLVPGTRQHLGSIESLAAAYDYAERYTEAEGLFREVLRRREAEDPSSPHTARALTNLALNLSFQDRNEEAVPVFERALAACEQSYGPRHLETAAALNGLGTSTYQLGRLERADELFTRALAIREEVLGPDHPQVAVVLYNLSSVRLDQARAEDALALAERALRIREATLPRDHPWRVSTAARVDDIRAQLGPE